MKAFDAQEVNHIANGVILVPKPEVIITASNKKVANLHEITPCFVCRTRWLSPSIRRWIAKGVCPAQYNDWAPP